MNTPRDNEKTTEEFRQAMLKKLNANNHKKHWNEADINWLFFRKLDEEIKELRHAIMLIQVYRSRGEKIPQEVIDNAMEECADGSNMLLMIFDNISHGIFDGSVDSEYLEPKKDVDEEETRRGIERAL